MWVGGGNEILIVEQGKIFVIYMSWTFQGDPNADRLPQNCFFFVLLACFIKQLIQWTGVDENKAALQGWGVFLGLKEEGFFLFEGKGGNVIQSSSPLQKLGLGMTQEAYFKRNAAKGQALRHQMLWWSSCFSCPPEKLDSRSLSGFSHYLFFL